MKLYRCEVEWKEMDMSGGDSVDGARWTGDYIPVTEDVFVGADNEALAAAGVLAGFYGHQDAVVKRTVEECSDLLVVTITKTLGG